MRRLCAILSLLAVLLTLSSCFHYVRRSEDTTAAPSRDAATTQKPPAEEPPAEEPTEEGFPNEPDPDGTKRY